MPLPVAAGLAIQYGAPVIAGMLGGKGSSKPRTTNTNQTSTRTPWGPTQGPLNEIINWGQGLFNNYWPSYPEKGPPGFSPSKTSKGFLDEIRNRTGGTDLTNSASSFIQSLLGGGGANSNNSMAQDIFGSTRGGSPLFDAIQQFGNQGTEGIFRNSLPQYQELFNSLLGNPASGFGESREGMQQLLGILGRGGGDLTPRTSGYVGTIMDYLMGENGSNLDKIFGQGGSTGGGSRYGGMTTINMGGPSNTAENPYFQQLADSIREEMGETYERTIVPQIDSEYQRAGRYGSGAYQLAQARANEEANEAIGNAVNDKLFEAYENERNRQMQAAQTRAASAQGAYGANQSARLQDKQMLLNFLSQTMNLSGGLEQFGSSTGLGTAMDIFSQLSGQEQFGQELGFNALQGISGMDQFSSQLGLESLLGADASNLGYLNLGGQMAGLFNNLLQGDQQYNLGLINSIPGLENITNQLLLGGLGASQGFDTLGQQGRQNQWQFGFDKSMYESNLPYQMLSQYLNMILPIASQFGTDRTTGQNIQPGAGFIPGAIQGAAGGAKLGQGLLNRGGGSYMPVA